MIIEPLLPTTSRAVDPPMAAGYNRQAGSIYCTRTKRKPWDYSRLPC
jgi:hypothetical protein